MADEAGGLGIISRTPTTEEKKNYSYLTRKGSRDAKKAMKTKRELVRSKYVKQHLPYCATCAIYDFDDLIEQRIRMLSRSGEALVYDEVNRLTLDISKELDLESYGPKFFELIGSPNPVAEQKLMDGIRNSVVTGYAYEYKCKKLGHKNSVWVPLELHEERTKKKGKK